jgi:hypothetical protein
MEPSGGGDVIDGRAVLRGAAVGLALIVPVTIVRVVLEHHGTDFSSSGWVYPLSVLIVVAEAAGGLAAAWTAPGRPLVHGGLAGGAAVVLWVPVRIVIWGVREDGRGLFTGSRAALPPGQLVGALALGVVAGGLGGLLGRRVRRGRAVAAGVPSGAPR